MKSNVIVFPLLCVKATSASDQFVGDVHQRLSSLRKKIVTELQNAEGGAFTGVELKKRFGLSSADLRRQREEYRIIF